MRITPSSLRISALALAFAFSAAVVFAQAVVKWPGGRIAITSDGNAHDSDDIGGTPMSIALLYSAGLSDKLVHVDYANHFMHQGHAGEANKAGMMNEMITSTEGAAARFGGLSSKIIFNCQTQLTAATANFVRQALRSSASDPLWFICAGPMTTAYKYLEAVNAADPAKLAFIHCVSHSARNGNHDPMFAWEKMKIAYPTVNYLVIANQNSAGGEQGLCSALEHWDWLKNSTNADLRWLHSRNRPAKANTGKFDVSDAGMVYYVLSGTGNAKAGVAEFKDLLEHPRLSPATSASKWEVSSSVIAKNGMPKNIIPKGTSWNFGPGSLWSHCGWQYAAYWDDACQVSVARRQLPDGAWETVSLPDYQRTSTGDRGKDPGPSFGFGDGHEKISLGISPDGFIHLSFDHHRSTLRYRITKLPVAADPKAHPWKADLFGPVQNHLGGPKLEDVTYPNFTTDGDNLALYIRLGGGSGAGNSHYFTYSGGKWVTNTEAETQFIDQTWSGGDKTVNAYIQGLVVRNGRWHITWCWRDTPEATTCHDFCYAYSDDRGQTWCNSDGQVIAIMGKKFITADSPGIAVWKIPTKSNYRNGGSMTVDSTGRVHALANALSGNAIYFSRDPETGKWTRQDGHTLGTLVAGKGDDLFIATERGLFQTSARNFGKWKQVAPADATWFEDSRMAIDPMQGPQNDRISTIGQQGKTIRVVEYKRIKP